MLLKMNIHRKVLVPILFGAAFVCSLVINITSSLSVEKAYAIATTTLGPSWRAGSSMSYTNAQSGYNLSGTAGVTFNGSGLSGTFTASGGVSGVYLRCCMDSNPNSACNFSNEAMSDGADCGNVAVRTIGSPITTLP